MFMLCEDCEQRLGRVERSFSLNFFYPFISRYQSFSYYGEWMRRLLISIAWRFLVYTFERHHFDDKWPAVLLRKLRRVEREWRLYLLKEGDLVSGLDIQIIALTPIRDREIARQLELPPFWNRYALMTLSLSVHLSSDADHVFFLIKIFRFVFVLSLTEGEDTTGLPTSKSLNAPFGSIDMRRGADVPADFFEFFKSQACEVHDKNDEVTVARRKKNLKRNTSPLRGDAYLFDVEAFGEAAASRII